jgi:hypothetical protein
LDAAVLSVHYAVEILARHCKRLGFVSSPVQWNGLNRRHERLPDKGGLINRYAGNHCQADAQISCCSKA